MKIEKVFCCPTDKWVSLHDSRITKITCHTNTIVFEFQEGFTLVDSASATDIPKGYVQLYHCTVHDITCNLVNRKATKAGVKFSGHPISIDTVNKLLMRNYAIEIFMELYDNSFLHWHCALYPPKSRKKGLSPHIIIEASDFSSMSYCFD